MALLKPIVLIAGQLVQLGSGDTVVSPAEILSSLLTVDGVGSGLDADLLDGQSSAFYATAASDALKMPITGGNFSGYIGVHMASPVLNFEDTSQVLPAGYTRIRTQAGGWAVDINTHVSGNYATKLTPLDISSAGAVAFLSAPTVGGVALLLSSAYTAADVLSKLLTVDGAGSGLDADLLDGHSSAFFEFVSNKSTDDTFGGTGAGTSDTLYPSQSAVFWALDTLKSDISDNFSEVYIDITDLQLNKLDSSAYTAADVLSKLLGVDGAASGLDADLLDGQSSAFYQSASNLNAGTLAAARVADNSLPPAKVAFAATSRFLGRITAGAGAGEELTGANAATIIGYTAADVLSKLLGVDGAGSGLDADLLDGSSSAFFLDLANATGVLDPARINANTVPVAKLTFAATARILGRNTAGAGQGEELTGAQVLAIAGGLAASSYTAADVLAKLLTVDGAGSGLDADLLDGSSSAFYLDLGNATGALAGSSINSNSIPLTRLANTGGTNRFLGRLTAGAGAWEELTQANAQTALGYTAADVLAKLLTVDGAGSGLDADNLDGNSSAFYLDLTNQTGQIATAQIAPNAVTVSKMAQLGDQRILGNVSGATANMTALTAAQVATMIAASHPGITVTGNLTMSGALIGTGANLDIRKDTAAASDTEVVRIGGGGAIGSSRGGTGQFFGIDHATNPGNILMQAGAGLFKPSGANIGGILWGTKTWDPPAHASSNTIQTTTVTVTGAAVGDLAIPTLSTNTIAGMYLFAMVTAANTVTVTLADLHAGAQNVASGTLNVMVLQAP